MHRNNSSTHLSSSSRSHCTDDEKKSSTASLLKIMKDRNIGNRIISFLDDDPNNPDALKDYRSLKTASRDLQGPFIFTPYKQRWAAITFNVISFLGTPECGYGRNSCCGYGPNSCCCMPATMYGYDCREMVTGQPRYITDTGYREIKPHSLVADWTANWINTGKMIFCCGFNTPAHPGPYYYVAPMICNVGFGLSRLVTKTVGTVGCCMAFFAGSIKDSRMVIRPFNGVGLITKYPAEARELPSEKSTSPRRQTMS